MLFTTSTLLALMATAITATPVPGKELATPAPFYLETLIKAGFKVPQAANAKRNLGGVRLSTGKGFTGSVWYGIWPLNTCIGLGG